MHTCNPWPILEYMAQTHASRLTIFIGWAFSRRRKERNRRCLCSSPRVRLARMLSKPRAQRLSDGDDLQDMTAHWDHQILGERSILPVARPRAWQSNGVAPRHCPSSIIRKGCIEFWPTQPRSSPLSLHYPVTVQVLSAFSPSPSLAFPRVFLQGPNTAGPLSLHCFT